MKKTIWKFKLKTISMQEFEMPVGAEILTVQTQNGALCIWVLVNPTADKETRTFEVIGTGHYIYHDKIMKREYIGTCQLKGDSLVLHVFEYINR